MQRNKNIAYGFLLLGMVYTLINGDWIFFVFSVIGGSLVYFAK